MSRYFYCSALWSSHRLLKQSPLINIYSLSDGTGSIERGEREERVWIIIIHLNPALSLFSTCLWGRSNGFRQEFSVWARDGKWEDRHDMFLALFLLQLFFTFVEKCYNSLFAFLSITICTDICSNPRRIWLDSVDLHLTLFLLFSLLKMCRESQSGFVTDSWCLHWQAQHGGSPRWKS